MWQPVLMISGYFISVLGLAMLFPAIADIYYSQATWSHFFTSAIVSLFIGFSLFLANHTKIEKITLQQGYLLTVISWFSIAFLASIPFLLFGVCDNLADAVFEATSGISTTGATILTDIDNTPRAILFWRSLLNGLGGVGIVVFAVALLPFLGIGGIRIFQRENSDFNDKVLPKISYIAKRIIIVYVLLLVLTTAGLKIVGMDWFNAINHALTSVSTGGFSTKTASVGYFNNFKIEFVLMLAMVAGSLPLTWYLVIWRHGEGSGFRTAQVPFFLKVLACYILGTAFWLTLIGKYDLWQALRYASFNIISITTSTGYFSTDYMLWGAFTQTIFIIFALTGGCTGSTSGGIKIFRWQVIFAYLKKSFINATEPNRITPVKVAGLAVDDTIINSVFFFVSSFIFSIVILTFLLALTGLDLTVAFSGIIGCITNSGPGVGNLIGPAGSFAPLSDTAKWICSFAMLLGRLEVLTVVVVFTRSFWKK